ncbi:hypothetical protein CEXT_585771 [Caerostris extrusa]|uniref:Uncharacterized protein n=1 Tax=Caerostris extrusa TaxID=172846 RepID=A0AAV4WEX0_CAEEX|nr:hypothetical protein CEXT_585771 [Caerostris extrusa]
MEKETSSMSSAESKYKDKTFKLTTLFSRKEPYGKHKKETETEKETKSKKEKVPKSRVSHTKSLHPNHYQMKETMIQLAQNRLQ